MHEPLLQYVEPIYRFCLKRLASRADAEDLSQEILLCILQSLERGNIANIDAYIWRIAHNRYARLIQARKGTPVILYGQLPDLTDETENEIPETHQAVYAALHTLSSMYRDIMVDYYVHSLDIRSIAARYGVTVETVKWRLHAGREKIKERMNLMEKNYNRIKMHVMANGGFAPDQYLDTQLKKAIAKVCYQSPLTLEEISLATGVPTLYLEEPLEHMIWGDAIEQIGNKYATNFIITPADKLTTPNIAEATDGILKYVQETENQLREIGFYGSSFPLSHLLHILIPAILSEKGHNTEHQDFPKRKDGGFGWFIVTEGVEELDWRYAGGNYYHTVNSPDHHFNWYWTGDSYSQTLNNMLSGNAEFILPSIGADFSLAITNKEDEAKAIVHNLCKNEDGRVMPAIPIFTKEEYTRLREWAKNCDCLDTIIEKRMATLKTICKTFTPKRLADQIDGNVAPQSFDLSAYVIKELQNQGLADIANGDEIFAKGVFMVR